MDYEVEWKGRCRYSVNFLCFAFHRGNNQTQEALTGKIYQQLLGKKEECQQNPKVVPTYSAHVCRERRE